MHHSVILPLVRTVSPNRTSRADLQNNAQAAGSRANATPGTFSARTRLLIPAMLLVVYVLQCGWFIRTQSMTYDEPCHVYAGLDAWRNGRFFLWNDHPSLPRLWLTLPLLSSKYSVDFVDPHANKVVVREVTPDPITVASRGRWMNVVLGVALAMALWFAARAYFSVGAANFALALYVFSPDLIAHFSLVTTDGIAVLMIFVSAVQLVRWRHDPSWPRTIWFGVVLGGLLLSKFYAPAFFLIALIVMLMFGPAGFIRARQWHWGKSLAAMFIALFLVWAAYFFHVTHLTISNGHVVATFPNRPPFTKDTHSIRNLNLWLPAGEYIDGLREVQFHNKLGHPAFFLGKTTSGKIPAYYPVAMLLKWPPVVLATALVGLVLLIGRWRRFAPAAITDFVLLAVFPLLSLALAINARLHIGVRHVLPAYPFLLLLAAGTWWMAQKSNLRRIGTTLLIVFAVLNAADALRSAPDYLSYFTPFVSAAEAHNLLTDSNLDWGQGLLALRGYQQQHPDEPMSLAYFGTMDPALYGIRYTPFSEGDHPMGKVVISATLLSGQYSTNAEAYRWLEKYPLKAVLDDSLYVYDVR